MRGGKDREGYLRIVKNLIFDLPILSDYYILRKCGCKNHKKTHLQRGSRAGASGCFIQEGQKDG